MGDLHLSVNFVNHYCLLWKWPLMRKNMLAINICSQKGHNHWFCVPMIHSNQLPLVRHLNPVVGPRKNLQGFGLAWTETLPYSVSFSSILSISPVSSFPCIPEVSPITQRFCMYPVSFAISHWVLLYPVNFSSLLVIFLLIPSKSWRLQWCMSQCQCQCLNAYS